MALQEPSIPIVRIAGPVDPQFAERNRLCQDAPTSADRPVENDARRSVQQLLGPALREIEIYQLGDSFTAFPKATEHVRSLLRARPRSVARFTQWAEGTPFRTWGVLGALRYTRDRVGRLEAVGNHLCVTDSTGVAWWIRLEAVDVWPDDSASVMRSAPPARNSPAPGGPRSRGDSTR